MKKLTSLEIRNMYLNFFKEKKHMIFDSAPIVPINDNTLLFINAGITPLKKFFDGTKTPPSNRITSCQKCIRTNDIENVGNTSRHQTFFEMLGNFSIGDYFREDALTFAIELLTSPAYFDLDLNKLYFTIYPSDIDTKNKWMSLGVDESHIIKLEGNFWEIGEGPSGPCTEIFYDRGNKYDKDNIGIKLLVDDIENDRYIEIWNIVFSQFNADPTIKREEYKELASKNIDTGMGLERISCILQDVETNFETDLFIPYINYLESITNIKYTGQKDFKIIADHIRTLTIALNDKAFFSNEKRGYVLRRLLRRASFYGKKLNIQEPFLYKIVDLIVDNMKGFYKDLGENKDNIKMLVKKEEELFLKTLSFGEKKLTELMNDSKDKYISGSEIFKLYDTYGFPFELSFEILENNKFNTSIDEYNKCMEEQKNKARLSKEFDGSMNKQNKDLLNFKDISEFCGYNDYKITSKVIYLMDEDNNKVNSISNSGYVILDKTPFYKESGGQISDTGIMYNENTKIDVLEVFDSPNNQAIHKINIKEGILSMNDNVTAEIFKKRRDLITANHSCCHLLQKAMQNIIGKEVSQAGSKIDVDSFRFDFFTNTKLSDNQLVEIENEVNNMILKNSDVLINNMTLEDAKKTGAMALFEDKYKDVVRVVKIGDSIELCGGTHVKNTSLIKKFAIIELTNKGANTYRIEGTTNDNIEKAIKNQLEPFVKEININNSKLEEIIMKLELKKDEIIKNFEPKYNGYLDIINVKNVLETSKKTLFEYEKRIANLNVSKQKEEFEDIFKNVVKVNDFSYIVYETKDYDTNMIKEKIHEFMQRLKTGFIFIANINTKSNSVNFICLVSNDLSDKYNASKLVTEASKKSSGNGGGSKTFATGGGSSIENINSILDDIKNLLNK